MFVSADVWPAIPKLSVYVYWHGCNRYTFMNRLRCAVHEMEVASGWVYKHMRRGLNVPCAFAGFSTSAQINKGIG